MKRVKSKKGATSRNISNFTRKEGVFEIQRPLYLMDNVQAIIRASQSGVSCFLRDGVSGFLRTIIISAVIRSMINPSLKAEIISLYGELLVAFLTAMSYIRPIWTWTIRHRIMARYVAAIFLMIDGFGDIVFLHRKRHFLSRSYFGSLFTFLVVTVLFVIIMGYEAQKKPGALLKESPVTRHGRNNKSSVVIDNQITRNDKGNLNETYDIKNHHKELMGPMFLLGTLITLIRSDIIRGDLNPLHPAAMSFYFLSYILGITSILLNLSPPKVQYRAHREKVENALGVLNFLFIFLVIVTVVTIAACYLGAYALLNAIPLLANYALPQAKIKLTSNISKPKEWFNMIYELLLVVAPSIIELSGSYRYMVMLFGSMGLVFYLGQKVTACTQPMPKSEEKHLD